MKTRMSVIIGIISIILGIIFAITTGSYLFGLLILAGIVLLFAQKDSKKKFKLFLKSFRIDKKLLLTAIVDIIYWVIFFLIISGAKIFLENKTRAMALKLTGPSMQAIEQSLAAAKQIFAFIIGMFVIVIILTLIFYTLSRYLIWNILTEKKFNKRKLLKFFFLNLLWWLIWIPISIILITGVKQTWVLLMLILVVAFYIYMTTKLHHTMIKTNSIKKSFTAAVGSLTLIPKFLPAIACIVLVYFILVGIFWILGQFMLLSLWFHSIIFILYVVWIRKYLKEYIEKFKI